MKKKILGVDRDVLLLGIVSFLTDVSSEMIFSVFSVFFTIILQASTALLGIVEGLADFASSSLDYVAGFISDRTGKRKVLTGLGYGFSTLAKAILLIPNSVVFTSIFRIIERLGKSFRGPPRDAWIASIAEKKIRGYSFGVHEALDSTGAILGPLLAYWILNSFGANVGAFGLLFKIALVPAVLSILVLLLVKERRAKPTRKENMFRAYKTLSNKYKHYFYSASIFSFGYFSFAFLLLKAYDFGFKLQDVALIYALFNASIVFASPLVGKIGDYIGRKSLIASEYVIYFLMNVGFIFASTKLQIALLFILFGIFFAIDEDQSKAYISDLEKEKRGTAIGFYNFATGMVYIPASLIAGALWTLHSNYAFGFAGVVSIVALIFFLSKKTA